METLVSVVMGSRSDWQTMKHVSHTLASMSISHEVRIVSAHRTSEQLVKYAKSAEERGVKVIVASERGAVHLPGILASKTNIPVFGVPLKSKALNDKGSLFSNLELPVGFSSDRLGIGPSGAVNAAMLAASMLANNNDSIRKSLKNYRENQLPLVVNDADSRIAV